MSPLSETGRAALELAQEYGFRVFPLYEPLRDGRCSCGDPHTDKPKNIGKHPRLAGGFKRATTHPERICAWWDLWPNANIGLYPGPSQLIVVDIDGAEGEVAARAVGAFDVPTLEVMTRRGAHRYFRLPARVTVGNVARTELDVRAHNGYVLAPPSVHASGFVYQWRGDLDAIADVSPRLLETLCAHDVQHAAIPPHARLRAPSPPMRAPDARAERRILAYADGVGYGRADGRKTAAFVFAAFLVHDVGLDDGAAWRYLAAWNGANAPPLSDDVLMSIHANARLYGGRVARERLKGLGPSLMKLSARRSALMALCLSRATL